MTILLSFFLATVVYALLKRRVLISSVLVLLGAGFAVVNWHWICLKFAARPYVWMELLNIVKRHFLIGTGFNKTINVTDLFWVSSWWGTPEYGVVYKHNDYLALMAYKGAIVVIPIAVFIAIEIRRLRKSAMLIPFLACCIAPFFQNVMQDIYRASLFVSLIAMSMVIGYGYGQNT